MCHNPDILKVVRLIFEEGVATENPERKVNPFEDHLSLGSEKVAEGRLEKFLSNSCDDPDDKEALR